jgi:hypothetical protein
MIVYGFLRVLNYADNVELYLHESKTLVSAYLDKLKAYERDKLSRFVDQKELEECSRSVMTLILFLREFLLDDEEDLEELAKFLSRNQQKISVDCCAAYLHLLGTVSYRSEKNSEALEALLNHAVARIETEMKRPNRFGYCVINNTMIMFYILSQRAFLEENKHHIVSSAWSRTRLLIYFLSSSFRFKQEKLLKIAFRGLTENKIKFEDKNENVRGIRINLYYVAMDISTEVSKP